MGPVSKTNTFRKEYRELSVSEQVAIENIKTTAEKLEFLIVEQREIGKNGRHLALAMTKLEESIMWAVKAITE